MILNLKKILINKKTSLMFFSKKYMGHLVNPISSQLKFYGSWSFSWGQYFRRDFSYFFFLDQYFRSVLNSINHLKKIFNKFFVYDISYLLKNNKLFFFFSFKSVKKMQLRVYWFYGLSSEKKRKMRYRFDSDYLPIPTLSKVQKIYKKVYKGFRVSFLTLRQKDFERAYLIGADYQYNFLKKIKHIFPNIFKIFKKLTSLKIEYFNLKLLTNKTFNKYLLKVLFVKSFKLKYSIFKEVSFLKILNIFGKILNSIVLSLKQFHLIKKLYLNKDLFLFIQKFFMFQSSVYIDFRNYKNKKILAKRQELKIKAFIYYIRFLKLAHIAKHYQFFICLPFKKNTRNITKSLKIFKKRKIYIIYLISFIEEIKYYVPNLKNLWPKTAYNEIYKNLMFLKVVRRSKNKEFLKWFKTIFKYF